ncbi:MAG: O-antigen ligase family protein [Lachnospiraceae bacterium]|nr:O-antigen ligase family protein [Lachnospiraceae bacterium]
MRAVARQGDKQICDEQTIIWFLTVFFIISLVMTGGYTQWSAALLSLSSGVMLTLVIIKSGKVMIGRGICAVTIPAVTLMYLVTALWAADRGMALEGFFHFLPLFLFYALMNRVTDEKERLIRLLPVCGSLMTIFSFLMMQFSVFRDYVSVANRLAGFFQYPNTYALFMLICLIVASDHLTQGPVDWLDMAHCAIAAFGIFMSGSRTTFLLLLAVLLLFAVRSKNLRRFLLPLAAAALLLVALLGITGVTGDLFGRLLDVSFRSSTFLGRLLYAQDSLRLILAHPFGCGYYGYYFLQGEVQTGVYSVVNVHNELLQMMLDIGILPALLFYGTLLAAVCKKCIPGRDRLTILVLMLHSLLDYDFQFLSILFVLILFLNQQNGKGYPVSMFTKVIAVGGTAAAAAGAVCIGSSDLLMMSGRYEASVWAYNGNTLAKTYLLTELEDVDELSELAVSITKSNSHVPLAYHAMAQAALVEGKISDYIDYKETALQLSPYDFDSYTDYLDGLSYCFSLYLESGETESAEICYQRVQNVQELLEQVKEKTSWLGWQIDDAPQVTLPEEYQEMIVSMGEQLES